MAKIPLNVIKIPLPAFILNNYLFNYLISQVLHKMIKYDRHTLNTFFRMTYASPGQVTPFSAFMSGQKDYVEITLVLCFLGQYFVWVSMTL